MDGGNTYEQSSFQKTAFVETIYETYDNNQNIASSAALCEIIVSAARSPFVFKCLFYIYIFAKIYHDNNQNVP